MFTSGYDFGYPWWMTWGHLVPFGGFGLLTLAGWWFGWRAWLIALCGLGAVWGLAGFVILQQVIGVNRPLPMPTRQFLPGGSGRVVDLGAGSGRATLMVLGSRPQSTVVALDLYSGYWGIADNTPDRLRANASVAGVADRVTVEVGDMRDMPFPDASFDGAVSSFAIDHLNREGIARALRETARVLRPGGQILIMNMRPDVWVRLALPTPPGHGYFGREQAASRWRQALSEAGLTMVEEGTQPGTVYYLARK